MSVINAVNLLCINSWLLRLIITQCLAHDDKIYLRIHGKNKKLPNSVRERCRSP